MVTVRTTGQELRTKVVEQGSKMPQGQNNPPTESGGLRYKTMTRRRLVEIEEGGAPGLGRKRPARVPQFRFRESCRRCITQQNRYFEKIAAVHRSGVRLMNNPGDDFVEFRRQFIQLEDRLTSIVRRAEWSHLPAQNVVEVRKLAEKVRRYFDVIQRDYAVAGHVRAAVQHVRNVVDHSAAMVARYGCAPRDFDKAKLRQQLKQELETIERSNVSHDDALALRSAILVLQGRLAGVRYRWRCSSRRNYH